MHSKKPLLKELQNLVTPYYAASWKEIGLQLGIPQGILQSIEINFQTDVETCCTEMLTEWLETDVAASWGKLIQVVYSPAVTEIINAFNKSPFCNRNELAESEAVEELENKLKERHTVTRYRSSQEDWFSMPEHFTSVALIHQKRHKTKREIIRFANMHLKGNVSESGKITTDIAEIFALVECTGHPYTLLIEGAPGIGKTILSKEIVFQWAKGSLLKDEKLVCLIYLRDPKVKTLNTFESFIKYISYSQVSKGVEQYIYKKSGKGICFVFDGYDEYPEKLRESSFLSDVINREVLELQLCNIIVTSRPSASACLHNNVDLRVEILGFTKAHRKSYIVHALKDNPKAIQHLLEYLESSYAVDAYCHIPLSMAILVFLFKESDYDKNQLPASQTEINYKFVCITIRRFIKKSQQKLISISKFSEVPTTHKKILLEISKLAFTALEDDKIVFNANEIRDFCPSLLEDPKHWNGLDLLKAVQYFSLEENKDELSFNFLHFSVQELLAAYHISLMSETQQIKLLKETFWNIRYFNVWIMYVALTKDQPFAFKHFLSGNRFRISTKFSIWWSGNAFIGISKNMKENKIKCLHLFQCFTEAGNDDMCHYVGNLLQDGTIDLSGQPLSAIELYTLSSFLARCIQRHWSLLDLSHCFLDDENFERFCKSYASLTKSTIYINTLNLSSNVFTQVSASQIVNLVLNFNVKNLVFATNEIKDIEIDQATFSALLEHPNLVQSRFIVIKDENHVNFIRSNGSITSKLIIMYYCTIKTYKDVCIYIENNSSFFDMLLNTNNVSIFKIILHNLMSKMTSFSTNFKFYVETVNSISEEVNNTICNLASNVPLAVRIGENCLPLHLYNISDEINDENEMLDNLGTIFFCGNFSVKTMSSIFSLVFAKSNLNQIYLNGIILCDYITYVSPKCISLNSLQLLNCYAHDITRPNAVVNVLSMLIKTASLKHLNLSACRFKTKHMKVILEALKQVVGIKTIAISGNNISKEVCDILSSVIACNRELQSIEVSNCNLQEAEIVSITKALENCEDLQSLDLSNNVIADNAVSNVTILIKICQSIKVVRLQNCQLHYAGIQEIVEVMVKMTCLCYIDFSDNPISDQNAMLIARVIANNKNLQKLNFSNCKLQSTGCQNLFQAMAKITNLVHLDLSNNLFTGVAVDNFTLTIHQNVSLEILNISGCFDKAKDFEKVTGSLVTLKSLNHLDLSCNVINYASAENIAIVITNNAFLEDLNLSKCEIQKFAFPKIIIALQNNHHLKCLNVNLDSVGYEEATGISMVISNNPFLENVDFSNCYLTEKAMKTILSSLRNHTSLKHFDISSNTITNHVVNEIVDVIDSNTQLTHLNISDTDVREYGILKIFKAAQRISTLRCIKLCNCTISDRAAKDIADAVTVNHMMEELVFTNNDFHEKGITLLLDVLKDIHMLKRLTLASNHVISNIVTNIITYKVKEVIDNNCLTYFDISNCYFLNNDSLLILNSLMILNSLILQTPNIRHVDLSGNNLNGTAEYIAKLISVSHYLQYLNLSNTSMQDEEIMIIVKAIRNTNSLRYVYLTSYSFNDKLALELTNTCDKNPAIFYFQLHKICSQKVKVATLVKCIATLTLKLINLQDINIYLNDHQNDEIDAIATLINNSPSLQYLYFKNCTLLEVNIDKIVIALTGITTLKKISFIGFSISEEVEKEMAAIINNNNIAMNIIELDGCKLTEGGLAECIKSMHMARLSRLNLSKNDFTPHIIILLKILFCDSVTHLELSNCKLDISKLSNLDLCSLRELTHLNLSHNPLTDQGARILSTLIINNTIKHLDLCNCNLKSDGIKVVANALRKANVTYLDLSFNTVNIKEFNNNVLPALLCMVKVIEHLLLPCCNMKQKVTKKLMDFVNNAIHLKYIDVGSIEIPNNMTDCFKNIILVTKRSKKMNFNTEGIKQVSLTKYETQNLYHSLHYLNINNITVDDKVANTVASLIANSPKLEHLEMVGGKWNFVCPMKCLRSLQYNKYLQHLNLSNNSFTLTEIFSLLTRCTALKILHLHSCGLKDNKVVLLMNPSTSLLSIANLIYFDLSNNSIDDEVVNYLAVVIATNIGLQHLNLCNCNLKSSSIRTVNHALKLLSSLKFLDVSLNNIYSKNVLVDQAVALLTTNKHLEELRISKLVLDNNKFNQIQSTLLVVKGLQQLIINDCFFTDEDVSRIVSVIANNPGLDELCLFNCEMSTKSKIRFSCIATALYMQILNINTITFSTLHLNSSKFTDNDVVVILTVSDNLGELILDKLILNQNNLDLLSDKAISIRNLNLFHVKDCIFSAQNAHYVASLITNNATTIQSFSLIGCKMSVKHKTIILKAMCKLDIVLLEHLDIKNNIYIYNMEHLTILGNLKFDMNKVEHCKLTDDIVAAVLAANFHLKLSKLVINQSTLKKLKKSLILIKGLNHLTIKECKLDYDNGVNIANVISHNKYIQEIVLSNCEYSIHYVTILGKFRYLSSLNSLIFENFVFTNQMEDQLTAVIANNLALERFSMARCNIEESGLAKIMHSIANNLRNLQYIDFSHLECIGTVIYEITVVIRCNKKLMHINLCNCQLNMMDTRNILQATRELVCLKHVDLGSNTMSSVLLNDILFLIANNKNITTLSLPMCAFDYYHLQVIINTMKHCTLLTSINFSIKEISSKSIADITTVINNNSKIKEVKIQVFKLVLSHSEIHQLSSSIIKFTGIHHIVINGCKLDVQEWKIVKQFGYNQIIDTLTLCDCTVMHGTMLYYFPLRHLVLSNVIIKFPVYAKSSLESFSLSRTVITEEVSEGIQSIVQSMLLNYFEMVDCNIDSSNFFEAFNGNVLHLNFNHINFTGQTAIKACEVLAKNETLTHITTSWCSFDTSGIISFCNAISGHYNIVHLNLSHTKDFGPYAKEIGAIIMHCSPNLTHVEMANCHFNEIGIYIICRSLGTCRRLQYLDLSHNDLLDAATLLHIGKYLEHIKLQNCGMYSTCIKHVFMALANTASLRYVDLSMNSMSEDSAVYISKVITNNKHIEVFLLPNGSLSSIVSSNVMKCLQNFSSLRLMDIRCIKIESYSINDVTIVINNNKNLITLKLSKLLLNQNGIKMLSESDFCTKVADLKHLSITDTTFQFEDVINISTLLLNNLAMQELILKNCHFPSSEKIRIFQAISLMNLLQYVDVNDVVISDQIEDKLVALISGNIKLRHLELAGCQLSESCIDKILLGLRYHSKIHLNISNNLLTNENIAHLADLVKYSAAIEKLQMSNCNITNFYWILTFLDLKKLKHLDLSHNIVNFTTNCEYELHNIDDENLQSLSLLNCALPSQWTHKVITQLKHFTSLQYLNLSLNTMENEVVNDVAFIISKNKQIKHFSLPSCSFSNDMIRCIFDAIKRNEVLKLIDFNSNQVNDDLASDVEALTASTSTLLQFFGLILGHSGFKQLGNGLLFMQGLNYISITGVHFGYTDACNLAVLIDNNKSLQSLDISSCVISEVGKLIIFKNMICLTSLKSLNLKNTVITDTVIDRLLDVIEKNTDLEYLEVTGCEINTAKLSEVISDFNKLKVVI